MREKMDSNLIIIYSFGLIISLEIQVSRLKYIKCYLLIRGVHVTYKKYKRSVKAEKKDIHIKWVKWVYESWTNNLSEKLLQKKEVKKNTGRENEWAQFNYLAYDSRVC